MSFLTPLYALGLLAVLAPIVFHLIRRSPRGEVPFSALLLMLPRIRLLALLPVPLMALVPVRTKCSRLTDDSVRVIELLTVVFFAVQLALSVFSLKTMERGAHAAS